MTRALWAGVAAICLAGLLLYGFGTSDPNTLRWSVLAVAASVLAVGWAWQGCPVPSDSVSVAVIGFVAYAALSLLWTLDWRQGLISLNQLSVMALLFLAAIRVDRDTLIKGVSAFASLGIFEHAVIVRLEPGIFGGLGNENFQSEFLVIIAPLAAMSAVAWKSDLLRASGILAALYAVWYAIGFNVSDAKWAGFAGIAGFGFLWLVWNGWFKSAASTVFLVGTAVAAAYDYLPSVAASFKERIELTYNTAMVWLDHPVFGGGIGSFNYAYPFHQEDHLGFMTSNVISSVGNYAGAAHNEFVQALAVFGVAGVVLLVIAGIAIFRNRSSDSASLFGAASFCAFLGMSLVGFPAQSASTAILGVLALSLLTKVPDAEMGAARHCLGLYKRLRNA